MLSLQQIRPGPTGQSPGQLVQLSVPSQIPLPHVLEQSLSDEGVHPAGQHPSLSTQAVITVAWHLALHEAAEPMSFSTEHPFELQLVGHEDGGSQVSPGSIFPFPHSGDASPDGCPPSPEGRLESPEAPDPESLGDPEGD
jgi:hypothetical protein